MRGFARDAGGATALMFGLALPALAVVVGAAVDHGRFAAARTGLQAAADAAALAAAGELRLASRNDGQVAEVARAYAAARLAGRDATAEASVSSDRTLVEVTVRQVVASAFGPITGNKSPVVARASARLFGRLPVCVIALDGAGKDVLMLDRNALMSAPGCGVYSNSTDRKGLMVDKGASLTTGLTCTSGGRAGSGRAVPTPTPDCPPIPDPLAARPLPAPGPCTKVAPVTKSRRLSPGTYCGGLSVSNGATLTLDPGVYVMKDGPLLVTGNGRLIGTGVGVHFSGKNAVIRFAFESHVRLEAPSTGPMAGLLFTEDRASDPAAAARDVGDGDGDDDDDDDEGGGGGSGSKGNGNHGPGGKKKGRAHYITSDDAATLLGTIYLPRSRLRVDANRPVAQASAYTVMVVLRLDLDAGPNLVLNTNYAGTTVPTPPGVGPGAGKVTLER